MASTPRTKSLRSPLSHSTPFPRSSLPNRLNLDINDISPINNKFAGLKTKKLRQSNLISPRSSVVRTDTILQPEKNPDNASKVTSIKTEPSSHLIIESSDEEDWQLSKKCKRNSKQVKKAKDKEDVNQKNQKIKNPTFAKNEILMSPNSLKESKIPVFKKNKNSEGKKLAILNKIREMELEEALLSNVTKTSTQVQELENHEDIPLAVRITRKPKAAPAVSLGKQNMKPVERRRQVVKNVLKENECLKTIEEDPELVQNSKSNESPIVNKQINDNILKENVVLNRTIIIEKMNETKSKKEISERLDSEKKPTASRGRSRKTKDKTESHLFKMPSTTKVNEVATSTVTSIIPTPEEKHEGSKDSDDELPLVKVAGNKKPALSSSGSSTDKELKKCSDVGKTRQVVQVNNVISSTITSSQKAVNKTKTKEVICGVGGENEINIDTVVEDLANECNQPDIIAAPSVRNTRMKNKRNCKRNIENNEENNISKKSKRLKKESCSTGNTQVNGNANEEVLSVKDEVPISPGVDNALETSKPDFLHQVEDLNSIPESNGSRESVNLRRSSCKKLLNDAKENMPVNDIATSKAPSTVVDLIVSSKDKDKTNHHSSKQLLQVPVPVTAEVIKKSSSSNSCSIKELENKGDEVPLAAKITRNSKAAPGVSVELENKGDEVPLATKITRNSKAAPGVSVDSKDKEVEVVAQSSGNHIKLPCQCNNVNIQCYGPYNERLYFTKKVFGQGIEMQKLLKHEKDIMAGYLKIYGNSSISGKASNNTVYFVVEGKVMTKISGNVNEIAVNDCFMVVQNSEYEIKNVSKELARLSFVKTSKTVK